MKRLLLGVLLLTIYVIPAARAQTKRTVYGWQLWPEVQAELALPGSDYLLLTVRGQNETDNNGFGDRSRVLGFDERRVTVGYEHFWNERWSVGGTLGYISLDEHYVLVPEVLLRHRSPVGPLTLGQRLSLERTFSSQSGAINQTNARLRVDLEKILALGQLALRPRLSYEAVTHVRLLRSDTDPDERTIQFTSLRGELGVRVREWFDCTPWVAYQTNYSFGLAQTDASGNVIIPAGRVNSVAPVLGLEVRFTWLQGSDAAARQQLPTQH
ncbi:hypothetical protein IC235_05395 [Hymenobacter sp. BT664]|uniref:DUF2490 domain-containing protein n=1 Tax=Hymenobacter montanus TaxID=2771359 RepID=A0A927GIE7_9BACT|nr:hypothetical protein [Hymenobacter montanus]MBD2767322.1 hypothetical protein [Hymenobacter montanus]